MDAYNLLRVDQRLNTFCRRDTKRNREKERKRERREREREERETQRQRDRFHVQPDL